MTKYAFLWSCPSCGEYVRTELPPTDAEAELVCSACGARFGERTADASAERTALRA